MPKCLRIIFWDQLSHSLTCLNGLDKKHDTVMLLEVNEQATRVKHHKKKLAYLYSCQRHFAEELRDKNIKVRYSALEDNKNTQTFIGEILQALEDEDYDEVHVTQPSEYDTLTNLKDLEEQIDQTVIFHEDNRFLCTIDNFASWAKGRKQLRMENFYREMRKKYNILMDGEDPAGGSWNYDADNRHSPNENMHIPETYTQSCDQITEEVIKMVERNFSDHFGDLQPFHFAVTRDQARIALKQFVDQRLKNFGTYQDAMIEGEPWMYHSHLSFYINNGLLTPLECIEAAEQAYYNDEAPINSVEGFIRQILGWREYVRGIYWLKMPKYRYANELEATRKLPDFFWTAQTKMNCLKQCISETKLNAYAHHIQRLMVLGNFTLISGIAPTEVNEWYWIVYADAYEWVELPNVSGMILFSDGGSLATKPYAASGSYINKMSNYCKNCHYSVKEKTGEQACPFNYMYWHLLHSLPAFSGIPSSLSMQLKSTLGSFSSTTKVSNHMSIIFTSKRSSLCGNTCQISSTSKVVYGDGIRHYLRRTSIQVYTGYTKHN